MKKNYFNLRNYLLIIFPVFLFLALLVFTHAVRAGGTANVTATVTVQNISVSVADGAVGYGTLATSASKSTCTGDLNDLQTVTNDGNVAETFNIKGQDSANWTLAASPASDAYTQKFLNNTCSTFSGGTALTTSYQTLATNVATSGTKNLNLQISTPTSSSDYTQQSVNVTVQAVAY